MLGTISVPSGAIVILCTSMAAVMNYSVNATGSSCGSGYPGVEEDKWCRAANF